MVTASLVFYSMPELPRDRDPARVLDLVRAFPGPALGEPGATALGLRYIWNVAQHAALPIIALTIGIIGQYVVIMRSSLPTRWARTSDDRPGDRPAPPRGAAPRHPNAILPVVALSAISFGFVISGATVIEAVFSWPGMGELTYKAHPEQRLPVMQAVFLVASFAVILANLFADLATHASIRE